MMKNKFQIPKKYRLPKNIYGIPLPQFFRSKKIAFLFFICSFFLTYTKLSPIKASVVEKNLSISFASTDVPPFSLQASILHAINSAQKSIDIAIYALLDKKIIESLKKAAAIRDVRVSVIVDPSATPNAQEILGDQIHVYERAVRGLMHTKIIIIDKKIVWYGTMNLTKTSLCTHGNMGCGIYSPQIASYCIDFMKNLIEEKGKHNDRTKTSSPHLLQVRSDETSAPSILFALHPIAANETLQELLHRIHEAKKHIFVAMYTFTHEKIAEALLQAKIRGVDVRILFDKDSSRETSKNVYRIFEERKMAIGIRKKKGLLHYKCALIDSSFVIGSANWTKAAFSINAETFSIIDNIPEYLLEFLHEWWNRIELDSTLHRSSSLKTDPRSCLTL